MGVSVELDAQIDALLREREDLKTLLPAVRVATTEKLKSIVTEQRITEAAAVVVKNFVEELRTRKQFNGATDVRATIYIQDLLFDRALLQVIDYIDHTGAVLPGRTAGRAFSQRYGIIGRVWRSGLSEVAPKLAGEEESSTAAEERLKGVAQTWGLTLEEAEHVQRYPSFLCIPFPYGRSHRALLFMDATSAGAFASESADQDSKALLEAALKRIVKSARLDAALMSLEREAKDIAVRLPNIEVA